MIKIKAMHNTSPAGVETSLKNYCLYYSSIIELEFNSKTNKHLMSTAKDVIEKATEFLMLLCVLGLVYSVVEITGYAPFGEPTQNGNGFPRLFEPRHLANNCFMACEWRMCYV